MGQFPQLHIINQNQIFIILQTLEAQVNFYEDFMQQTLSDHKTQLDAFNTSLKNDHVYRQMLVPQ